VRGLLVAAVDQEIQAATDNPRPKFKFAGKATLLPGLGAAATAAFAITLSRSAPLSSEQLEDAFLASGISSAARYDLEEAAPVDLSNAAGTRARRGSHGNRLEPVCERRSAGSCYGGCVTP